MKPLRFLTLRALGTLNPNSFHPALAGAAVFFCALSAFAADTNTANKPETPAKPTFIDPAQCNEVVKGDTLSVYDPKGNGTSLKKSFDPANNCAANLGGEDLSNNALAIDQAPDIRKFRGEFNQTSGMMTLKSNGACRAAYDGVREVFDAVAAIRADFCEKVNKAWTEANNCGPMNVDCKPKWEAVRDVFKNYGNDVNKKTQNGISYLNELQKAANTAATLYKNDLNKLENFFKAHPEGMRTEALAADVLSTIDVRPTAGNRNTTSLRAYYSILQQNDTSTIRTLRRDLTVTTPSGLIPEEETAAKNIKTFGSNLVTKVRPSIEIAGQEATALDDQIKKIELNATAGEDKNKPGWLKNATSYTGTITGAGGLAQQLMKNNNGPEALTGLGNAAASAVHEAAGSGAEVAAAAGIGALAAHAADGASRAPIEAPAEAPAAANTGNAPAVAALDGSGGTAGNGRGEKGNGIPAPYLAKGDGVLKVEGEAPAVSTGTGLGFGEGSSRAPSGRRPGSAANAAPSTTGAGVDAGGAGTTGGDMGGTFSQNLAPKPAPAAAAASPGSEVANLLGQMKNLFNFDENGGPGGMPGGVPGGAPGAMPPPDGGQVAGAPGETPAADGDATATPGEAGAAPVREGNQSEEVKASPFGKVDTSLFARVRYRHHRCMERGLVLYGLKERVE